MPLVEEIIVGYEAYRAKIEELEKLNPKDRVVVVFEGGDTAGGANWDAATNDMVKLYDELRKDANLKGTMIRVKVPAAEWKNPESKYKNDGKFKVASLPFAAVFNQKTTLGRNWVHKKLEGEKTKNLDKLKDLFK